MKPSSLKISPTKLKTTPHIRYSSAKKMSVYSAGHSLIYLIFQRYFFDISAFVNYFRVHSTCTLRGLHILFKLFLDYVQSGASPTVMLLHD